MGELAAWFVPAWFPPCQKVQPHRATYGSLAEIGAAFVNDMKAAVGAVANGAPVPFADVTDKKAVAVARGEARVFEYGATGVVMDTSLHEQGFRVGVEVVGPDGVKGEIKNFLEGYVAVRVGKKTIKVEKNSFNAKWQVHVEVQIERLACQSPSLFGPEHKRQLWKVRAQLILYEACMHLGSFKGLEHKDPFPTVWATREWNKGELRLLPYTTNITIVKKGEEHEGVRFSLNQEFDARLKTRSSLPSDASEEFFLVPFWHVHPTTDSAEANTEMKGVNFFTYLAPSKDGCPTGEQQFVIPYMTNSKKIRAGEQLLQYRMSGEAAKRAKASKAQSSTDGKRRKTIG